MNTTVRWPAFIITLVLAFTAFTWWSFIRAAAGVSAVTDPDYYSHGLKYNSTTLEQQAGEALGWTVRQQVAGRRLTIRVEDSHQVGIPGCQGAITFPGEGTGASPLPPLAVTEIGAGLYQADIPATLPQTLMTTLTIGKGQAMVHRRLLLAL
jgi:nitrogen fixation protein FixH